MIKKLMGAARGEEIKYIIRGMQGKLRIGLAEQSVISALAQAIVLTPPSKTLPPPILDASQKMSAPKLQAALTEAVELMKQVVSECPSYDMIIPALLEHPLSELHDYCYLTPGIPVQPMLAKPTKGISEVLDRFQGHKFTCEYKYDGERAQVGFGLSFTLINLTNRFINSPMDPSRSSAETAKTIPPNTPT